MKSPFRSNTGPPYVEEEDNSFVSMSDIALILFISAIVSFAIIYPFINPEAVTKIPQKKVFYETVTWNSCIPEDETTYEDISGQSRADIDSWTQLTTTDDSGRVIKDVIGYKVPDRKSKFFILNTDDVGGPHTYDDTDLEIITSRLGVLQDGNYLVNVHLFGDNGDFQKYDRICADVRVSINLGEPHEKLVCDTTVEFTDNKQQKTACQFDVRAGDFVPDSDKYVIDIPIWQVTTSSGSSF